MAEHGAIKKMGEGNDAVHYTDEQVAQHIENSERAEKANKKLEKEQEKDPAHENPEEETHATTKRGRK